MTALGVKVAVVGSHEPVRDATPSILMLEPRSQEKLSEGGHGGYTLELLRVDGVGDFDGLGRLPDRHSKHFSKK